MDNFIVVHWDKFNQSYDEDNYLQGYTIERSWITKYVLIAQNLEVMINLHTSFHIISRRVYLNEGQF